MNEADIKIKVALLRQLLGVSTSVDRFNYWFIYLTATIVYIWLFSHIIYIYCAAFESLLPWWETMR